MSIDEVQNIPGPMTEKEMTKFLGGGELSRLSCIDCDGWPYTAPVWYHYQDNGFYFVGREQSKWAIFLSKNSRAHICIDTIPDINKVLVKVEAAVIETPNIGGKWVDIARSMSIRYLGADGPKYLEPTMTDPRWLIYIKPIKILTWRGNFSRLQ